MYKIINKQIIGIDIKRIEIAADTIARKAKPGQFVMVMAEERGERIPLSIVDTDPSRGAITLVFEEVGISTKKLGALQIGHSIFSLLGPLGLPSKIESAGNILCVGYGISISQLYSIAKAYRQFKNKVIGLIGARTKRALILESQMRLACHKLYITTEDGSYERRGRVTDILSEVIRREEVQSVYAVGPLDMMEAVSQITKEKKIKTHVSLKPVMVDGIGLCGSCRVKVNGKEQLACVDGPEFDGHQVDFKDLMVRA